MSLAEIVQHWALIEADFHREYRIADLTKQLTRRTWRWFTVHLAGLSADSLWMHTLYPVDPKTGKRERAIDYTDDQVDRWLESWAD